MASNSIANMHSVMRIGRRRIRRDDDSEDERDELDLVASEDLKTAEALREATTKKLEAFYLQPSYEEERLARIAAPPLFRRLYCSDPVLGTLGTLPDEIVAEICKYLVPPEVRGIVLEGDEEAFFADARDNVLNLMRTGSRLYSMMRELSVFKSRTYHFAASSRGYSFEGHQNCPPSVIQQAMRYVGSVQVDVEIDVGQMDNPFYRRWITKSCHQIEGSLRCLDDMEKHLDRYDVEISIVDSRSLTRSASSLVRTMADGTFDAFYGHRTTIHQVLEGVLDCLMQVQNATAGTATLMSVPLSSHPVYDCSKTALSQEMRDRARATWKAVQGTTEEAGYLLSWQNEAGCGMGESSD